MPIDILILSNGPGEVTTWVRPVVKALRQQLGEVRSQIRISLILSPCPHASGREVAIAQSYPEIDRIQAAEYFWSFLLWGKTRENWEWRDRGVVIFLGGDQFFPVVIGRRLGYHTVIYGEWEARWHRWIDRFVVMQADLIPTFRYADKFTVVGDLMAEAGAVTDAPPQIKGLTTDTELIGILPGSKPAKLMLGMPLGLAIAQHLQVARPHTRFVIPVAPTLDLPTLARFARAESNPLITSLGGVTAELITSSTGSYLLTPTGVRIDLWTATPAYDVLRCCRLCLTTIGANTAELGALGIPMIVLLPTNQIDIMRAWNGLSGVLANLPGVGSIFAKWINQAFIRQRRLLAWPNIWAGEEIVPELLGHLDPREVAEFALGLLQQPEHLQEIRDRLRQVRGQPGAAEKIALIVEELVDSDYPAPTSRAA
jgi:lipid-A-disaccharide synthase